MKIKNKISIVFLGLAMLAMVAGFCDALVNSAFASMDDSMMGYAASNGQMHFSPSTVVIHGSQDIPMDKTLKPCCAAKSSGVPNIKTNNFEAGVKLLPVNSEAACLNLSTYFQNKLETSSNSSPPKPDKISSVLRLE